MLFSKADRERLQGIDNKATFALADTANIKAELERHRKNTEIDVASAQTILGKLEAIAHTQDVMRQSTLGLLIEEVRALRKDQQEKYERLLLLIGITAQPRRQGKRKSHGTRGEK